MASRCVRLALFVLLPVAAAAADETLATAYKAILRGDYETGRATVDRMVEQNADPDARRAQTWLTAYHNVVASRNELRHKTFAWNIEQAKLALDEEKKARADGDAWLAVRKQFVALNFVAQAVPYLADPQELRTYPWVVELMARSRQTAAELAQQDQWKNALSYYLFLGRIAPDDDELKDLTERATRHARFKLIYKEEKELEQRLKGVKRGMLRNALLSIAHMYYKEADFRELARGGLDNLLMLCDVRKLQEFLHGLGNPATRALFVEKLTAERTALDDGRTIGEADVRSLFERILQANRETVSLPEQLLIVEFMEGALGKLDDYTGMIWPADAADFDKVMVGDFEGVGIQLGVDDRTNRLKVVTPLDDSPALEAGIQPDDLIIAVNGETTAGWTTDDAVRNIMGPGGTEVELTIKRPSTGEDLPFKLTRRKIAITTVRGFERRPGNGWNYMLDKDAGVAYIRLTGFHPKSAAEMKKALADAREQGMRGLVLDVRHNPGGLLDVVIDIVSLFVDREEVVSTRGRTETEKRPTVGRAKYKDLPLVVLINEGSASASEILAGALQDYHRAVVLGDRTFGKGSVQHVKGLGSNGDHAEARLKLTTALYYLPSGRTPHKAPKAEVWGVDPDWALKLTPKEFRRVLERERDSNVIHNEKDNGKNQPLSEEERGKVLERLKAEEQEHEDEPPLLEDADIKQLESDPTLAPEVDPQLETALLLVRVKLAADVPWPSDIATALEKD
ncbi:MAG: S41 family peptidase [Planctomycetota bacterium]